MTILSPESNMQATRTTKGNPHVNKWLVEAGLDESGFLLDASECAQGFSHSSPDTQDKTQWLLQSDETRRFLSSPTSQVLLVDAETPPDDLINPLSLISAFLAQFLSTAMRLPALIHMCGIRTNDNISGESSGPLSMMKSLNAQLLQVITRSNPDIDLSFLAKKSSRRKSQTDLSASFHLFQRLLDQLSPEGTVFIIVDSVMSLTGPSDEAEEAIRTVLKMAGQAEPITKVLLSGLDASFLSSLDEEGHPILCLPDYIDGNKQGVAEKLLREETQASMDDFRSSQKKSIKDPSSTDSDSSLSGDDFIS